MISLLLLLLQCLKYKTDQQVDVRKMEKLNALFFAVTATGERPSGAHPVVPVLA